MATSLSPQAAFAGTGRCCWRIAAADSTKRVNSGEAGLMTTLAPRTQVGPYEILSPIGKGGMGVVYKARDTRLDRIVALKISKSEYGARFEREARTVASLNHPNVCTLFDVGPNYLVMEYIDCAPLKGAFFGRARTVVCPADLRCARRSAREGDHAPGPEACQHPADQIGYQAIGFRAGQSGGPARER